MLKTNAINAINALLEAQLMAVSRESGIDISILQKYVGDSSAPVIPEKKKRAPPKKKVVVEPMPITDVSVVTEVPVIADVPVVTEVPVITDVPVITEVPEKKKRAPPKKKVVAESVVNEVAVTTETEVQTTDVPTTEVPEKKKRAPPKKKVVAEPVVNEVAVTTETEAPPIAEKKKRAPPKKKVTEVPSEDAPVVEEKKKRAPPKKKTEPANKCYICKNEKDLCSTGNSDGYVCKNCISNPESTQAFCITCKRYEETDGDGYCGKCQDLAETETVKLDSSDDEDIEYVESSRHPVREVDVSGTVYLVDNEEVAFLKSSKKRVGKYNRDKHRIQALDDSDSDSSSDDELPIDDDDM